MKNIGHRAKSAFPASGGPVFRRSDAAAIVAECMAENGHLNSLVIPELMRLGDLGVDLGPELVARVIERADVAFSRQVAAAERSRELAEAGRRFTLSKFDAAGVVGEVVYYMRIGDRVKIGTSASLAQRLETINPEELMATERGDRRVESRRHRQFADLRVHGEWFRLEGALIQHIDALRVAGHPK